MVRGYIAAKNLEVTHNVGRPNEFRALTDVNIEIYKGEYIILFGPSGAGKSTLMHTVMGSLPPSEGALLVGGDDIYAYEDDRRAYYQRNIRGIIYQQFDLIPSLSVRDNVALSQIFAGIDKSARSRRAQAILERFGVGMVANNFPATLSRGQQQCVSISRSMVNDPEILLADEPTGNLDSVSALQVMDKIREINNEGKTVIVASHNAAYLSHAHRVFYLNDGKIVRTIVNPQRKQIKKVEEEQALITEFDQLARLYPYDSVETLRVKSIINYLTQEYDFDQLERLSKFVREVVRGAACGEQLVDLLTKQYSDGGIGIDLLKARELVGRTKAILTESLNVKRFQNNRHLDLAFIYQHKFLKRLQAHLLKVHKQKLNGKQKKNLEEVILDRISGVTSKQDLIMHLKAKISRGGVGLHVKKAYKIASYFEKLLAHGVSLNTKEKSK